MDPRGVGRADAAARAVLVPRRARLLRGDARRAPRGFPYIEPVELAWGLASPLIGRDPEALVDEVVPLLAGRRDWQLAILSGLTVAGPQRRALERALPPRWERRRGTPTVRHVASLDGGIDGFLSRRSRELRKSLRKSLRAAADAGVTFESVRASPSPTRRALRADPGRRGAELEVARGRRHLDGPDARVLRARCCRGCARAASSARCSRGSAIATSATSSAPCSSGEYRGLQFSYDDDHAQLGIGGLLQYHQIVELCGEGVARYDLGTEMDYKRRWAEEIMETEMLVLVR